MIGFLRVASAILFVGFLCLVFAPFFILCLPFRVARIKIGNLYGKILGPVLTRFFFWTKVEFVGRERLEASKPAIYLTNHCANLDGILGMWICPWGGCGIAKKEILTYPFFGQLYFLSGHLTIDRKDRESAIASMQSVSEFVKANGLSLFLWPEGTRSKDGRLQPFKKGFVHLALVSGLPVVPIVVHNAHKIWGPRGLRAYPGTVKVEVLPAIDTSDWTEDSIEDHVQLTERQFIEALNEEQKPLKPEDSKPENDQEPA